MNTSGANQIVPTTLADYMPNAVDKMQRIADVLNLGTADKYYWSILPQNQNNDNDPNLLMLHVNKEAIGDIVKSDKLTPTQKSNLFALRGVFYDYANEKIIARSNGITNTVTSDHIPNNMTDSFGRKYKELHSRNVKYTLGFNGVLIRICYYNEKVHVISHKRKNITGSKHGKYTYEDMLKTLGCPKGEDLFDLTKEKSNIVYSFLIVHPDLQYTSKAEVGSGFLIFAGLDEVYEVDETDTTTEWIPKWDVEANTFDIMSKMTKLSSSTPIIYRQTLLTLERANAFIKYGFFYNQKDEIEKKIAELGLDAYKHILIPGEFIIAQFTDLRQKGSVRISSEAFNWREAVTSNNPNQLSNAFQIYDYCVKEDKAKDLDRFLGDEVERSYTGLFPKIGAPTLEQFNTVNNMILPSMEMVKSYYDNTSTDVNMIRQLKYRNALLCLIIALPKHLQSEAMLFYNVYLEKRSIVQNFIINNKNNIINHIINEKKPLETLSPFDSLPWSKNKVASSATKSITRIITEANKITNVRKNVNENIKNLINKEYGTTLYQLAKIIGDAEKNKSNTTSETRPSSMASALTMIFTAAQQTPVNKEETIADIKMRIKLLQTSITIKTEELNNLKKNLKDSVFEVDNDETKNYLQAENELNMDIDNLDMLENELIKLQ